VIVAVAPLPALPETDCEACGGTGVMDEQFAMPSDSHPVLANVLCRCQEDLLEEAYVDDVLDEVEGPEEEEEDGLEPCPSCRGRRWNRLQAFEDDRVVSLRVPCGCMTAFCYLVDTEEAAPAAQRVCRVCGCTDERACEGGCEWVEGHHLEDPETDQGPICSSCYVKRWPVQDTEGLELISQLVERSRDPGQISISPHEAFLVVGALQLTVTHTDLGEDLVAILGNLGRQVQTLFGGRTWALLEQGWHREFDRYDTDDTVGHELTDLHPICGTCLAVRSSGGCGSAAPDARTRDPIPVCCCFCGLTTDDGNYVHADPEMVPGCSRRAAGAAGR